MGTGAWALLCPRLGFVVHGAARDTRSGRVAALGRLARGDGGEGHVRLYGAELFPPAPRGGPGGVSAVCESPCAGQEMNWGTIKRGTRNAERGTAGRTSRGGRTSRLFRVPTSPVRVFSTQGRAFSRSVPTPPPPPKTPRSRFAPTTRSTAPPRSPRPPWPSPPSG